MFIALSHSTVGITEQPEFVNAVAQLETDLAPETLLDALLEIEQRFGRIRAERNDPRTLDLDLLLYGDQFVSLPRRIRACTCTFVLYPLAEIAPDLKIPAAAPSLPGCRPSPTRGSSGCDLFGQHIPVLWQTVVLLALSNVFMTFAWYSHLKHLNEKPWWIRRAHFLGHRAVRIQPPPPSPP